MKTNRKTFRAGALCAAVIITSLAACAPFATYPPVEGSVGIDNPRLEPVPSIMADAIWYVHTRHGGGHEDFAINLPEGTPTTVYDRVLEILGEGHPMTNPEEWGYHITQIRSRGLAAEADVVFSRTNAPPGFMTLKMRKGFANYDVESAKVWNFPANVPPPHYPAEETRMAGEEADG